MNEDCEKIKVQREKVNKQRIYLGAKIATNKAF